MNLAPGEIFLRPISKNRTPDPLTASIVATFLLIATTCGFFLLPDSHMNLHRAASDVVILCVLSLIAGCPSPSKTADVSDLGRSEAAAPQQPIVFTDKESLQSGTGVMDDDAPVDFEETDSGLKYRVLRKSDGVKPTASNTVTVNYRGWLDNGREFDSSYKRGEPISFPLGGVIPGWTEGMQLVGKGGMIELWIPSNLGYGAAGSPPSVPPNATLHFIVELLNVK